MITESICTCMTAARAEGPDYKLTPFVTVRDPWCPVHKEYLFEYESKGE